MSKKLNTRYPITSYSDKMKQQSIQLEILNGLVCNLLSVASDLLSDVTSVRLSGDLGSYDETSLEKHAAIVIAQANDELAKLSKQKSNYKPPVPASPDKCCGSCTLCTYDTESNDYWCACGDVTDLPDGRAVDVRGTCDFWQTVTLCAQS